MEFLVIGNNAVRAVWGVILAPYALLCFLPRFFGLCFFIDVRHGGFSSLLDLGVRFCSVTARCLARSWSKYRSLNTENTRLANPCFYRPIRVTFALNACWLASQ